jgi:hypothetical protein
MIEAQLLATGKLPSLWRSIFSDVKGSITSVQDTFNESVAGMLLHITSLKDGWASVWDSMKQSAMKILSDILEYFERVFIAKIIANLAGGQSSWGGAFAGIAGGGGGGGGGGVAGGLVQEGEKAAGTWAMNALGIGGVTAGVAAGLGGGTTIAMPTRPSRRAASALALQGLARARWRKRGSRGGRHLRRGRATLLGAARDWAARGWALVCRDEDLRRVGWKASGFGAATGAGAGP